MIHWSNEIKRLGTKFVERNTVGNSTIAATGDIILQVGSNKGIDIKNKPIFNVPNPNNATEVANKAYVDGLVNGKTTISNRTIDKANITITRVNLTSGGDANGAFFKFTLSNAQDKAWVGSNKARKGAFGLTIKHGENWVYFNSGVLWSDNAVFVAPINAFYSSGELASFIDKSAINEIQAYFFQ